MKKVIYTVLGIVFVLAILGSLFLLYKKSKEKDTIYEVQSPFVSNVVKKTVATGSVIPRREIAIKPQVSGIIDEIYVEPGEKIKKGDLIAKIKIIPDMVALNSAESRLNKARLQLEDAKLVYDRQKKVYEQGVIPDAEFQKVRIEYNSALEEVESAENNLALIKEGITKKSGEISNTLIRSTIRGMILDVPVEVGTSVIQTNTFNEGTTIASIADMGEMIFEGKIDETEVGKIKEGMNLELTVGAIEDQKFDAFLEYISPKGTEENGTVQFEIKAQVKLKENAFIRAGYSATADIVLDRKDSVMVIPEGLLKFEKDSDSSFVEVETQPQLFEKRFVKTGLSDGINIEVLSGLTMEDKIKAGKKENEKKKKDQSEDS
jgi:HlyD family secretion protein